MEAVTLYQFELCPFCHKVKAALDIKGIPYNKIEVNPITKKELPDLDTNERRKVPVLEIDGKLIADSTAILAYLEKKDASLSPSEPGLTKSTMIETWVSDDLAQILPAVIYGKFRNAARAARVVARTSNFGFMQNLMVRGGGSMIMNRVAKKILARRGGGDPIAMLETEMDRFEEWLGDQDFVCGDQVSVGDVATHGCLKCIEEFPAFQTIMERKRVADWFQRVDTLRATNRAETPQSI